MIASRGNWVAVFVAIVVTTAAHGVMTNRWNGGETAPQLPAIPSRIGEWVGEDLKSEISDPGISHLCRRYTHSVTGRSFTISLSLGHPGLTAIHTPEYCYTGSGYEMAGSIERFAATDPPAEFWTTVFDKPGTNSALRIYWSWSADGHWRAPSYPRMAYLGRPALCKLYVVATNATEAVSAADPIRDDFVKRLLTTLNATVFANGTVAGLSGNLRGSPTPPSNAEPEQR